MKDLRRRPIPTLSDEVDIKEVPLSLLQEDDNLRLRQRPYSGIEALAADIRARGQTTPMLVAPKAGGLLRVIAGCRRKAALDLLKAPTALVRIYRNLDDQQAYDLAISENQDRDALTDMERADICLRLQKEGKTVEQIAMRMGWRGDRTVFRHLRVAREAPAALREALQAGRITMAVAIAFLDRALDLDEAKQRDLLSIAAEREMSAAELARELKRLTRAPINRDPPEEPIRPLRDGGFVINTTRVEADDPSSILRGIDVLQSALKRARRLKRGISQINTEEAAE